jgi:cytochrome c-type biogenesis protein CcmH/NrfG
MRLIITICRFRKLLAGFALGSLVLLSGSLLSAGERPLSYLETKVIYKAKEILDRGDAQQCVDLLEQFLSKDHTDVPYQLYMLLGNGCFQLNNAERAGDAYKKALNIRPQDPDLLVNYATALYMQEAYKEAAESFIKAFKCRKVEDPDLLYRAGACYYQEKHYREAKGVLNTLMALTDSPQKKWVELLVFTDVKLQNWDNAIKVLKELLQQEPNDAKFWKLLAHVTLNQGNYEDSAVSLEIAYQLKDSSKSELEGLASLYSYLGVPLKAAEILNKAYGEDQDPKQILQIARLYARGYMQNDALRMYRTVLDKVPSEVLVKEMISLLYESCEFREMVALVDQALNQYGFDDPSLYLMKGYAAWHLQDWDLAQSSFRLATASKRYRNQAKGALEIITGLMAAKGNVIASATDTIQESHS